MDQGADLTAAAVKSLADRYGASPAQIVLGWHLAQGTIVIPKSGDSTRMRENLAAVCLKLTPAGMADGTALEAGGRVGTSQH